jgi:hypothetical protein
MNWKKFFIAFIAAFVFVFAFGFIWYANLMRGVHMEVPSLFRTQADFPWLVLGHIVMAFFLTMVIARYAAGGGAGAGAALGFMIGLVYSGADFITYAVQPLTTKMLCGWILGDLIMFAVAGAIIGAIYKPAIVTTTP